MDILGTVLLGVGGLIALVGTLWWLGACFQTGPMWGGLAVITFPIVNVIWLFLHPKEGWKPALISVIGYLCLGGSYLCLTKAMTDQPNFAKAKATIAHNHEGIFNPYNPLQK